MIRNENDDPKNQQNNRLLWRIRICLAILTVAVCSLNIRFVTIQMLRHSRDMHRVLNRQLLLHQDLDIYWFGYRSGQYLINYPIHQYYFVNQFSQFLQRVQYMMSNLQDYNFGQLNQQALNSSLQQITIQSYNGSFQRYNWTIQQGFTQPFQSNNIMQIKEVLSSSQTVQIQITEIKVNGGIQHRNQISVWDISIIIKPFSSTSIFVTVVLQQNLYLGGYHILHFILGILSLLILIYELKSRVVLKNYNVGRSKWNLIYKFDASDLPDTLVCFFLIYSSLTSFINYYSVHYILLLDGVTCFISWLYILKLTTQSKDYYISFLIKKSYILVGQLFFSFGPMFIGFCLFALTAFCRYSQLFVSFHKSIISLFCMCYYNMTYQQFRTTQRANPISSIFFTVLVMLFTICIYSGMLVSVFCSYMWNKREGKNKQELLQSLSIQCIHCSNKYNYSQGYQKSISISVIKDTSDIFESDDYGNQNLSLQYKNSIKSRLTFFREQITKLIQQNNVLLERTQQHHLYAKLQSILALSLKQAHIKIIQVKNDINS